MSYNLIKTLHIFSMVLFSALVWGARFTNGWLIVVVSWLISL